MLLAFGGDDWHESPRCFLPTAYRNPPVS
jgi:hypothetical protein